MSPKLNLYIHKPVPLFKARVDMSGTIVYPVSQLTYDNVTLGAFTDIQFDCTLLLGTTEGGDDLGRVRVNKPASSSVIDIARAGKGIEDGTLDVKDNAHITVLDDYRVWAKIPWFNTGSGVDYKDGDIPVGEYTDEEIPPVANCGPGAAGYIVQGPDTLTVQFPRDGVDVSFPMANGATIVTHAWDVKDGTITVGSASDPVITATFPPGFRWVAYTVTDSNGISHTSRCPVLAIDGGTAPSVPDPTFKAFRIKQQFEKRGQSVEIEIFDELDRSEYPDGTLVMFWWGEAATPSDRNYMKFIGWVNGESHSVTRGKTGLKKSLRLSAVDVTGRLALLPGFPQALTREEEVDEEEDYFQWSFMPGLDMQKALHYLLLWHSTALSVADFTLPSLLTSYTAMRLDSGAATLFDQVDQQAQKIVPDHYLTCNAQGQMNVRRDWRLDDFSDRPIAYPIVNVEQWNDMQYEYTRHPKVHVLRSGAIQASEDWIEVEGEDTLPLVFSVAPSDSSAFSQGTIEVTQNEGLALDQAGLNRCEGHRYAMLNSRFGTITWKDPTGVSFWEMEPALMRRVQLNINSLVSTQRGLPFTSASGMVESLSVEYTRDKRGTAIKPSITWSKEEFGFPALSYYPEEDGTDPPPTPPVTVVPDFGLVEGVQQVALISTDNNGVGNPATLCRTSNFKSNPPTWSESGLYGGSGDRTLSFVVDPFSPGYVGTGTEVNGYLLTDKHIFRISDIFGDFSVDELYTFEYPTGAGAGTDFATIDASFGRFFPEQSDNPWLVVVKYKRFGVESGIYVTYSVDAGNTWSTMSVVTPHTSSMTSDPQACIGLCLSSKTPGLAYTFAYSAEGSSGGIGTPSTGKGYVTTDWGATWNPATNPNLDPDNWLGGDIHIPWPDNEDERLVYHGLNDIVLVGFGDWYYKTIRVTGTTIEDISPVSGGVSFGPSRGKFSIRTYDSDRSYVALAGKGNGNDSSNSDKFGVWVSDDEGDNWTEVVAPITRASGDPHPTNVAFSGDNPDVLFLWGTRGYMKYSEDFGDTWEDKDGPGNASSEEIIGIAGGPTS